MIPGKPLCALWSRPATILAVAALLLTIGGSALRLHLEREQQQEARLADLERQAAASGEQVAAAREVILARLGDLQQALDLLHGDIQHQQDALLRRVEALENRRRAP